MKAVAQAWSWGLPLSVAVASLLGSVHCAGMCGGLMAALASGASARLWFHIGRASSYIGLGVLAGLFGSEVLAGFSASGGWGANLAFTFFASILIYLGLQNLKWVSSPRWTYSLGRKLSESYQRLIRPRTYGRGVPFLSGLFLPLLPCGWLYTFVLTAAATGTPGRGGVTMLAFYLGTLPALEAASMGLRQIASLLGHRVGRASPFLPGLILIFAGLFSLYLKFA